MKRLESEMSEKIKHYAKEASNEFVSKKANNIMKKLKIWHHFFQII